jgi:hypothetical protein
VERHAHTQRIPGSTTQAGRDATVFWNYVDLRFRSQFDCQLRVELSRGELVVALLSLGGETPVAQNATEQIPSCETRVEVAASCEACGVTKCFRNPAATSLPRQGITAWLLDKFEPEFDQWMRENRDDGDVVCVPIRSNRVGNYHWDTRAFRAVYQAHFATFLRSLSSRRLAAQGAERQRALFRFDERLAQVYAKRLPHLANHLIVSQNLLPHLWRRGELGGRTFDVMMTRLPIAELEDVLDAAARFHPESKTLSDFRASPETRDAETAALAAARFLITPHSQIADFAGARAVKLDWHLPQTNAARTTGDAVVSRDDACA